MYRGTSKICNDFQEIRRWGEIIFMIKSCRIIFYALNRSICPSPCDSAWGHCYLHHECPLGGGAPRSGWQSTRRVTMGRKKSVSFYINFVAVATTNGQWVRHGTAWDGMAEEIKASLPFIFPPCRQTDRRRDLRRPRPFTFIPVWPPFDSGCRQFVVGNLQGLRA